MSETERSLFDEVETKILTNRQGKPGTEVMVNSIDKGGMAELRCRTSVVPGLLIQTVKENSAGDLRKPKSKTLTIGILDEVLQGAIMRRIKQKFGFGYGGIETQCTALEIGEFREGDSNDMYFQYRVPSDGRFDNSTRSFRLGRRGSMNGSDNDFPEKLKKFHDLVDEITKGL